MSDKIRKGENMTTCKKRILLVDDDTRITRILKAGLEHGNYEVCVENEAQMALPVARAFKPDLIVCDISMPGKDGDALAQELNDDAEVGPVPVIFLTGLLNKEEAARFQEQGETVLIKPSSIADLQKCIEERLMTNRSG